MKPWQLLALVSGIIIALVMALASVSYNATLATSEPAFSLVPVSNRTVFAVLALAFDLGMVASVFGILHWWHARRVSALACIALFAIASLFSIHSVRGYIATNVTKTALPAVRSADLYRSLKTELDQAQALLGRLRERYADGSRSERRLLDQRIEAAARSAQDARTHLEQLNQDVRVSPLAGLEWFLAITLWFFNATCWGAWFGFQIEGAEDAEHDTVSAWLCTTDLSQPTHCATLFTDYSRWCATQRKTPLAQYGFYARLIELGARKFRDGRNGPTKYVLDGALSTGRGSVRAIAHHHNGRLKS